MQKTFKKIVAVVMSITTISVCSTGITANAYSATRTIDNDSIASGYGNVNENNAYSYITANYLYNGDARIVPSSSSNSCYEWTYPGMSASTNSCTCKVEAYLRHADFTDKSAGYYVNMSQYTSDRIGYIDQSIAPSGWSTVSKRITSLPGVTYFASEYAFVMPSGRSGQHTGADGLKVTITS